MKLSTQAINELREILNRETGLNLDDEITNEEMNQFGNFLLHLYQSEIARRNKALKVKDIVIE